MAGGGGGGGKGRGLNYTLTVASMTSHVSILNLQIKTLEVVVKDGWGCSSAGRASDRHAAEACSVPRCGKGFFSQSQLSVQTLLQCLCTPVCSCMH